MIKIRQNALFNIKQWETIVIWRTVSQIFRHLFEVSIEGAIVLKSKQSLSRCALYLTWQQQNLQKSKTIKNCQIYIAIQKVPSIKLQRISD